MAVGVWQGRGGACSTSEQKPWPLGFSNAFCVHPSAEKLRPKDGERLTRGTSV